jgi:hypothetical protein
MCVSIRAILYCLYAMLNNIFFLCKSFDNYGVNNMNYDYIFIFGYSVPFNLASFDQRRSYVLFALATSKTGDTEFSKAFKMYIRNGSIFTRFIKLA